MVLLAGTGLPNTAVIIILDVVLTVVGSNAIITFWNVPGVKVTEPTVASAADISFPILPINEPVINAGDGFFILSKVICTLLIAIDDVIAPVIVIFLATLFITQLYDNIEL